MDMPLPIANAQMVDFVNLLMIINKSFNISEEEHRYKISFVNLASHEMRRDDPKLISHDAKIKRLKRGEAMECIIDEIFAKFVVICETKNISLRIRDM